MATLAVALVKRALRGRGGQPLMLMTTRRAFSGFDEPGRILREEERSREAVYMKKREAELLDRLRKQSDKLEQIKQFLAEYKKEQASLEAWLESSRSKVQET